MAHGRHVARLAGQAAPIATEIENWYLQTGGKDERARRLLLDACLASGREHDAAILTLGWLEVDPEDPEGAQRVNAARAAMYTAVLELGGTVSGEHGTGLVKREWLVRQRGEAHVRAMRAIKTALDPLGILNPGKIFPD